MYTRSWQIIRDDNRKTFEVLGQESNTDHFLNQVHGMQKLRMTVTAVILPVTNKFSSKAGIRQTGYRVETGLYARLVKEYQSRLKGDDVQFDEVDN